MNTQTSASPEARFELALKAARMGSWELDLKTRALALSEVSLADIGCSPADIRTWDDLLARVHPDDLPARQASLETAIRSGEDLEVEYRVVKPDGEVAWMLVRGRTLFDPDGAPVSLVGVSLDITERKLAEQRRQLLLLELSHRVKNTLATVQSIASQTRRTASGPEAFDQAFLARIQALARAHELLAESSWDGASLAEVIDRTLALYVDASGIEAVSLAGPSIRLGPNAAVTLNMAFHELATNAAKHGALSTETGRVEVQWEIENGSVPPAIAIEWRERGGPIVSVPRSRGFGSRLIEKGIAHELGGEARLVFAPDGLICRMRLPLTAKLSLVADPA
ncbi:MAG TPA: HWE histidine kinase domain-containing protein [Caulobacteraceae bacterium]|nr:HWE histidine kinase domain-containing protein [Caulobacteraceae bacterium]